MYIHTHTYTNCVCTCTQTLSTNKVKKKKKSNRQENTRQYSIILKKALKKGGEPQLFNTHRLYLRSVWILKRI